MIICSSARRVASGGTHTSSCSVECSRFAHAVVVLSRKIQMTYTDNTSSWTRPESSHAFLKSLDPEELFERIRQVAPPYSTRKSFAAFIQEQLGIEVPPRSLERWPLPIQIINGKATFPTSSGLEVVFQQLKTAPVIRSGRQFVAGKS